MTALPNSNADALRGLFPATTDGPEETRAFGAALAERLPRRAVVGLYGELGTGKTCLVKGIAEGLGIEASRIRSPTFTILRTYSEGRRPLHHFDAYRVQTPDEFVELGFEEYAYDDPEGITCIEWAGRVESLLPPSTLRLTLRHEGADRRRIALHAPDDD
jgi:tRNA threonylcarbamoyladenosine biosynthesis protein TsaE